MDEQQHLCDTALRESISQTEFKKLISGRHRHGDSYRCGGCQATFQTICVLHEHCAKHSEGGSYFFDHFTRTAFPKYETSCVFTQVVPEDFGEMRESDDETSLFKKSNVEKCNEQRSNNVRKSRRVVKKKTFFDEDKIKKVKLVDKHVKIDVNGDIKVEVLEENETSNEKNEQVKGDVTAELVNPDLVESASDKAKDAVKKTDGTEAESISTAKKNLVGSTELKSNNIETVGSKMSSKNYKTDACKAKAKKRKRHSYTAQDDDAAKSIKDNALIIDEQDNMDSKETAHILEIENEIAREIKPTPRKKRRNSGKRNTTETTVAVEQDQNVVGSDDHKYDELAASEVLLAMSKGEPVEAITALNQKSDTRQKGTRRRKKATKAVKSVLVDTVQDEMDLKEENVESDQANKRIRRVIVNSDDSKQYECPVCGKRGSNAMITYHKYLHMEKKSFACDKCGMLFQHPRSLQIHMRLHEEKQFKCDLCTAAFYRKQYLATHMLKHTGENPFMCDTCGKAYRDQNHLKRHIRHVHEKVRKFECDICKEKFFRSDHLKNHRLRHFEADKQCQHCRRMFKHPDDLLRHTKTHTGEKHWFCHLCDHGFVAVNPYYTHMAKKHDIPKEEAKILKDQLREKHKYDKQHQHPTMTSYILTEADGMTDVDSSSGRLRSEEGSEDSDGNQRETITSTTSENSKLYLVSALSKGKNNEQAVNMTFEILNNQQEQTGSEPDLGIEDDGSRKEAGCQTGNFERGSETQRNETDIKYQTVRVIKQLRDQSTSYLGQLGRRENEQFEPRTIEEDHHGEMSQEFSNVKILQEGVTLHAGEYRVIQTLSVDGSTVQVVHPLEEENTEERSESSEPGLSDRLMSAQGETTLMRMGENDDGVMEHDLSLHDRETVVLEDGTELGVMVKAGDRIQVNNVDFGEENVQTVVFIDDNQCADEVVIDQLSPL